MWKNLKHHFLMWFSPAYALAFRLEEAFAELRAYVQEYSHRDINPNPLGLAERISDIRSLDLYQELRIAEVLVGEGSQNWDVWEVAFGLHPITRIQCADRLMEQAREHLEMCSYRDRAVLARNRLLYAGRWYREAGTMTPKLLDEITLGLAKTAWVIGGPLFADQDPKAVTPRSLSI